MPGVVLVGVSQEFVEYPLESGRLTWNPKSRWCMVQMIFPFSIG